MVRTLGVVSVLVLALAIGGCGKSSDDEGGSGDRVSVDHFGKKVKVTGSDGETKGEIGEGVKVPAGFPKDIPLHESGKVIAALHRGDSFHVTLTTKDSAQKVIDAYSTKMKAEGWAEEQAVDLGTAKVIHFEKEGRTAVVSATVTDEGTTVAITTEKD